MSGDARCPESIKEKARWLLEKFGLEFGFVETLYGVHDYGSVVIFNRVLNVLLDDRRQSKGRIAYKVSQDEPEPCRRNANPIWRQIFVANKFECYQDEPLQVREMTFDNVLGALDQVAAEQLAA